MPLDMNIRQFGGELECFCNNLGTRRSSTVPSPAAPASQLRGGGIEKPIPTFKGMYSDEMTGGFEYEWMPHTSVGVKVSNRTLGRAIEDFLDNVSGEYFVGNPSEGTFGKTMVPSPAPTCRRQSRAHEHEPGVLAAQTLQEQLAAVRQLRLVEARRQLRRHVPDSTGQLDPDINSAFDYADFLVNASVR